MVKARYGAEAMIESESEYQEKFCTQMKKAMDGLLEPYGKQYEEYGRFTTGPTQRLCETYRNLLEKSYTQLSRLYSGNYPSGSMQEAIDKSKLLRKKYFWEKVKNEQADLGYEWYYLYDRKKAKSIRDSFFDELKAVLGTQSVAE